MSALRRNQFPSPSSGAPFPGSGHETTQDAGCLDLGVPDSWGLCGAEGSTGATVVRELVGEGGLQVIGGSSTATRLTTRSCRSTTVLTIRKASSSGAAMDRRSG